MSGGLPSRLGRSSLTFGGSTSTFVRLRAMFGASNSTFGRSSSMLGRWSLRLGGSTFTFGGSKAMFGFSNSMHRSSNSTFGVLRPSRRPLGRVQRCALAISTVFSKQKPWPSRWASMSSATAARSCAWVDSGSRDRASAAPPARSRKACQ